MAKKGGSAHLKRIAAPKSVGVARKKKKWLVRASPGAHKIKESIPLIVLVRDILRLADTFREAKKIIKNKEILIDGRAINNVRFPIGFMDVISIPKINKYYRALIDNKEKITLVEIDKESASFKLCKIQNKMTIKGARTQISTHDGRVFMTDNSYKLGDSIKIAIPENEIIGVYKLEPQARCMIMKGKHAGVIGVVDNIYSRSGTREAEAKLHTSDSSFITVKKYLFVVGNEI